MSFDDLSRHIYNKGFLRDLNTIIVSLEISRSDMVLTCLIYGKQVVKSLFTAVLLHVRVNALAVMLYSLIDVDVGGCVVGVIFWKTGMLDRTLKTLGESSLLSGLTSLFDRVGIIVVVVDWIAFDILHYQFKLSDRSLIPVFKSILNEIRPEAGTNILRTLFLE